MLAMRGVQPEEALAKEQRAILEKGIDAVWRKRIEAGDPFQKLLQQDKVRARRRPARRYATRSCGHLAMMSHACE